MPRQRAGRRGRHGAGRAGRLRAAGSRPGRAVPWQRLLPIALALWGCSNPSVRWVTGATVLKGTAATEYTLAMQGEAPQLTAVAQAVPIPMGGLPALGLGACLNSVRWARAGTHEVVVVWWAARTDSSVVLRLAHSRDNGAHWDSLRSATTLDRGTQGCDRPPPAVALNALHGYAHLAYWFEPAAGAGVYYQQVTDLADARGTVGRASVPLEGATPALPSSAAPPAPAQVDTSSMFHAPVGIVYGEGLAETSVAGHGDTVAVAYQDPNGPEPHIVLALSVTAGRAFAERLEVSGSGIAASLPVVVIDGNRLAVGWTAVAPVPGSTQPSATPLAGRRVVRLGVMR